MTNCPDLSRLSRGGKYPQFTPKNGTVCRDSRDKTGQIGTVAVSEGGTEKNSPFRGGSVSRLNRALSRCPGVPARAAERHAGSPFSDRDGAFPCQIGMPEFVDFRGAEWPPVIVWCDGSGESVKWL